jgi:hypothetical protein
MTAREHMLRFNPTILELLPDPDGALRADTARAAAIAAEYGLPPSSTGRIPAWSGTWRPNTCPPTKSAPRRMPFALKGQGRQAGRYDKALAKDFENHLLRRSPDEAETDA